MEMRKNVMVIPAVKKFGNTVTKEEIKKLSVAAYCRVSTDTEEQATSYDTQVAHYKEYISKNQMWKFVGIYADDGISGTGTKKREEFLRMIDDCMAGKIDMVITKSISRFARNTIDCLKYIRQLKDKNIPVIFEKENINTLDAKGEVLITIMASLAQQESESLSKNVKLGLQFRYQQGKVQINTKRFLGYTKDENGNLVIDPEQAKGGQKNLQRVFGRKKLRFHCKRTGKGRNSKWLRQKEMVGYKYPADSHE
jgi:DNA invertase Pin-like site-specific DNA recombinase